MYYINRKISNEYFSDKFCETMELLGAKNISQAIKKLSNVNPTLEINGQKAGELKWKLNSIVKE